MPKTNGPTKPPVRPIELIRARPPAATVLSTMLPRDLGNQQQRVACDGLRVGIDSHDRIVIKKYGEWPSVSGAASSCTGRARHLLLWGGGTHRPARHWPRLQARTEHSRVNGDRTQNRVRGVVPSQHAANKSGKEPCRASLLKHTRRLLNGVHEFGNFELGWVFVGPTPKRAGSRGRKTPIQQ